MVYCIFSGPGVFAQDYILDTDLDGYGGSAWQSGNDVSAYVNDTFFSGGQGTNYVFFESKTQAPEPSTLAIFVLSIMGFAARRSLLVDRK